jgi:hypothetical protein
VAGGPWCPASVLPDGEGCTGCGVWVEEVLAGVEDAEVLEVAVRVVAVGAAPRFGVDLEGSPRDAFVASDVVLASGLEVGDCPNHRQFSLRPTRLTGDVYPPWAGLPVSDV